ncbi:MAG TPA: amine dehydrogenase large subunit [Candidatus Binataceae bacterium]|jgi:methylamine dehydrogenase heavy chain|nr:amine dehydrogenase large subunit [Candidatus Binataceae bacterium]
MPGGLRSALVSVAICLLAVGALAQTPPPEGVRVRELGPIQPHWVFLISPAGLDSELASKVEVVDGDSLQLLGMLTGGMLANAALSPDHKSIFMAETFYSRGSRGDRTDVVTIYDAKRLAPAREVVIPPKRQLHIPPDFSALAVTPDGRFLLVANLTPATSMTVVDLNNAKALGEIETSGCTGALLSGPRQFQSLCGDGAMLTVDFDDSGKATGSKRMAKPFFDPEKDPVFSVPAAFGKDAYFVSYHGMIHPIDWSAEPAVAGEPWPLVTDQERKDGWRPGGYQPMASYAPGKLIYVLMHRGCEWTHKQFGTEVWVFNAASKQRVDKIVLPRPGGEVYVTQDHDPRVFVISLPELGGMPSAPMLQSFSAASGRYLGALDQLPGFPMEIFGP